MRYNESYKNDYFDITISNDSVDFFRDYSDCDLINIDVSKSLHSTTNSYKGEGLILKNVTLTSYDNYFLSESEPFSGSTYVEQNTKNGTTIFSDPEMVYVIENGDKFQLHPVSGLTGNYTYDIELGKLSGNEYYNQLKGGFYQGFYKIQNQPVEWFPNRARLGWTTNKLIHFPLYNKISGSTDNILNDDYSGNTGFIFYMGSRAENKFSDLTEIEVSKLDQYYGIKPKEGQSIYTYKERLTINGDDKYIGYYNYKDGLRYTGKSFSESSTKLAYLEDYSDLEYNAIGVRITPDGKIGYRTIYPTDKCYTGDTQDISGTTVNSFVKEVGSECDNYDLSKIVTKYITIEECYTKKPIIDVNEDKYIHISTVFERDFPYGSECELKYGDYKKGTISIYINGFLVLRNKNFTEIITHGLNDIPELQETVPYNISFGGGTQNLIEATYLDNTKGVKNTLDKFFAGTFLGGVKELQMLCTPLYTMEIKDIVANIKNKYDLKTINGGRKVFINKLF